jgi:hypothetical protein
MSIKSSNTKKVTKTRLQRKTQKPEIVIVSPKHNPSVDATSEGRVEDNYNYKHLNQSDSSSESCTATSSSNNNASNYAQANQIASKVQGHRHQHLGINHEHDHDRISLSSLNTILDDAKPRNKQHDQSLGVGQTATNQQQRRSSILRRTWAQHTDVPFVIGAHIAEDNHGICGKILLGLSWFLMVIFFPLSLFITLKVVQEYE